jgi:hypothetical protein
VGLSILGIRGIAALLAQFHWSQLLFWPWRRRGVRPVGPPRFYRRLEALLARLGLHRLPTQTPREFARVAAYELARRLSPGDTDGAPSWPAEVAALPASIVDAYYKTRFGGNHLDARELATIEAALDQLTAATNRR